MRTLVIFAQCVSAHGLKLGAIMKSIFLPALFAGVLASTHVWAADDAGASFHGTLGCEQRRRLFLSKKLKSAGKLFLQSLTPTRMAFWTVMSFQSDAQAETGAASGSADTSMS
jgi:hypothetical protein